MFWTGNWRGQNEKVYTDGMEYGVCCRPQELNDIVKGLDRYLKQTGVRKGGICKRFGVSCVMPEPRAVCWNEWQMDAGASKAGLTDAQGRVWYFALSPNRRFLIDPDGTPHAVWLFPERKDLPYIATLLKHCWYCLQDGEAIPFDSPDARYQRETFFKGLLSSVGFPLETLHVYQPEEQLRVLPRYPS